MWVPIRAECTAEFASCVCDESFGRCRCLQVILRICVVHFFPSKMSLIGGLSSCAQYGGDWSGGFGLSRHRDAVVGDHRIGTVCCARENRV
jgi:hypothetical protein